MTEILLRILKAAERALDCADHGEWVMINRWPRLFKIGSALYTALIMATAIPFIIVLMLIGLLCKNG